MKAAILCRVSTPEQEEMGYSLPAQEALLKEYCAEHALDSAKVFTISETATVSSVRKKFHEMLKYVSANRIQAIVAEKVDRVTREMKTAVEIDEWLEADEERQLHLVKDSLVLHKHSRSQEKLNWGIRIVMAKNYVDNLSEEVDKAWKQKIAEGKYPGHAKFGYMNIPDGKRKKMVPDPAMSHWVVDIFREFDSGVHSLRSLTEWLYEQGLRTPNGKKVGKTNIRRYLGDPIYIGVIEWYGKQYPGAHEPLITQDEFRRVQERLADKAIPVLTKHDYLFKGAITCAGCGGLITWEEHKGIVYGHCNYYRGCPQKTWVREDDVEKAVLSELDRFVVRNARLRGWISRSLHDDRKEVISKRERATSDLQRRLEQVVSCLDQIYEDKLAGIIDRDLYEKKQLEYSLEKRFLADKIHKQSQTDSVQQDTAAEIFDLLQEGGRIYKRRRTNGRRKILSKVFASLALDGIVFTGKMNEHFDFLANLIESTNGSELEAVRPTEKSIFELEEMSFQTLKTGSLKPVCPVWREQWDEFRTLFGSTEDDYRFDLAA